MKSHSLRLVVLVLVGMLQFLACPALGWKVGLGYRNASPSQAEIDSNQVFLGGYGILGWRGGQLAALIFRFVSIPSVLSV